MIICYCKGDTEQQIVEAIADGKLQEMHENLGPGTGCGMCIMVVRDIIIEEMDKLSGNHSPDFIEEEN